MKNEFNTNTYGLYAFEQHMEGKKATWAGYLYWLTFGLRHWAAALICKIKGHNYHIEGHANGNTGGDYATCTRCGDSWSHIYY